MSDYATYYKEILYPLQNGVLNTVIKSGTPFFLTGGTALSRYYLSHRYSDDLDLFVNSDPHYSEAVTTLLHLLTEENSKGGYYLDLNSIRRERDFTRIVVIDSSRPEYSLQIDLINDVAPHYGEIVSDTVLGRVDSWENILSNKLTALFRSEPKDVVDIWVLSRRKAFSWKRIIHEAKSKEVGVEPEIIYDIILSFPVAALTEIKWICPPPNTELFTAELKSIADDILFARDNKPVSAV